MHYLLLRLGVSCDALIQITTKTNCDALNSAMCDALITAQTRCDKLISPDKLFLGAGDGDGSGP